MPDKKPRLTPTEAKAVKAKIKAELSDRPQNEAAIEVFPNQTPEAAAVSMTRTLKKANVQEALAQALEEHGITVSKAVKPIADGLKAEKVHIVGSGEQAMAEVVPDHGIRLKASGMALKLMGAENESVGNTYNFISVATQQKDKYGL